ncbi:MAG: 50S ribosomal protein L31e [Candidatus Diapherotrites archaeon]
MADKKDDKKVKAQTEKKSEKKEITADKKAESKPLAAKAKEKFARPKETKKKEEKIIEKKYRLPLKSVYSATRHKRTVRAITAVKRFMAKHARAKPEDVLISPKLNEYIWSRGREHPPKYADVKIIIAEGKTNVYLQNEKVIAKTEKKSEKKDIKTDKKTEEEKEAEAKLEKKKQDKKTMELSADKAAMKKGIQK